MLDETTSDATRFAPRLLTRFDLYDPRQPFTVGGYQSDGSYVQTNPHVEILGFDSKGAPVSRQRAGTVGDTSTATDPLFLAAGDLLKGEAVKRGWLGDSAPSMGSLTRSSALPIESDTPVSPSTAEDSLQEDTAARMRAQLEQAFAPHSISTEDKPPLSTVVPIPMRGDIAYGNNTIITVQPKISAVNFPGNLCTLPPAPSVSENPFAGRTPYANAFDVVPEPIATESQLPSLRRFVRDPKQVAKHIAVSVPLTPRSPAIVPPSPIFDRPAGPRLPDNGPVFLPQEYPTNGPTWQVTGDEGGIFIPADNSPAKRFPYLRGGARLPSLRLPRGRFYPWGSGKKEASSPQTSGTAPEKSTPAASTAPNRSVPEYMKVKIKRSPLSSFVVPPSHDELTEFLRKKSWQEEFQDSNIQNYYQQYLTGEPRNARSQPFHTLGGLLNAPEENWEPLLAGYTDRGKRALRATAHLRRQMNHDEWDELKKKLAQEVEAKIWRTKDGQLLISTPAYSSGEFGSVPRVPVTAWTMLQQGIDRSPQAWRTHTSFKDAAPGPVEGHMARAYHDLSHQGGFWATLGANGLGMTTLTNLALLSASFIPGVGEISHVANPLFVGQGVISGGQGAYAAYLNKDYGAAGAHIFTAFAPLLLPKVTERAGERLTQLQMQRELMGSGRVDPALKGLLETRRQLVDNAIAMGATPEQARVLYPEFKQSPLPERHGKTPTYSSRRALVSARERRWVPFEEKVYSKYAKTEPKEESEFNKEKDRERDFEKGIYTLTKEYSRLGEVALLESSLQKGQSIDNETLAKFIKLIQLYGSVRNPVMLSCMFISDCLLYSFISVV